MKKQEGLQEPKKHDGMNVVEAEKLLIAPYEWQHKFYENLEYLRTSGKFMEEELYKDESFWVYLEDQYNINEKDYSASVRTIDEFPQYTLKYGVSFVSKVARRCGSRVDKVFADIDKEAKAHKTPLMMHNFETIIQKHRKIYEHEKATRRDQPKGKAAK